MRAAHIEIRVVIHDEGYKNRIEVGKAIDRKTFDNLREPNTYMKYLFEQALEGCFAAEREQE